MARGLEAVVGHLTLDANHLELGFNREFNSVVERGDAHDVVGRGGTFGECWLHEAILQQGEKKENPFNRCVKRV